MGHMINENGCKVDSITWWYDRYGVLQEGMIYDLQKNEQAPNYPPKALIKAGNFRFVVEVEKCFSTKEACIADERKHAEERTAEYKKHIETTEELVRFLIKHDTWKHKSDSARDAVRERAKELLGIETEIKTTEGLIWLE